MTDSGDGDVTVRMAIPPRCSLLTISAWHVLVQDIDQALDPTLVLNSLLGRYINLILPSLGGLVQMPRIGVIDLSHLDVPHSSLSSPTTRLRNLVTERKLDCVLVVGVGIREQDVEL